MIGLAGTVLKIEADRVQGGYSLGSGVAIAPDRIVTNCHVTREAQQLHVLRGGARWTAVAQLRDVEHDLCVLLVPRLEAVVATLADVDRLAPGQPVSALGYTGGLNMQYSAGAVVALHRLDHGRVIQSSNWFNSGASGGGLFDASAAAGRHPDVSTARRRGALLCGAGGLGMRALLDVPTSKYEPVGPDRSARLPYWQRGVTEQPRFLRAGLMERDQRWEELRALADEWMRDDPADSEPWFLLGVALSHLEQKSQAHAALACSIAIEPHGQAAQLLATLMGAGSGEASAQLLAPGSASRAAHTLNCGVANTKESIR